MTIADCDHDVIARVSPGGDDYTSCNKCGSHWLGAATPDYPDYEEEDE